MAELLRADGTREMVAPKNGTSFEFIGEAYDLIGTDMIQLVATRDGRILMIDEEGKLKEKPVNAAATALYRYGDLDQIVGDVLVCSSAEAGAFE
jgi:hypothetical protein